MTETEKIILIIMYMILLGMLTAVITFVIGVVICPF